MEIESEKSSKIRSKEGTRWHQSVLGLYSEKLRFTARACLLVNGILISICSVYFTMRFCWYFMNWLEDWLFAQPW